jgi:hypothetical protein
MRDFHGEEEGKEERYQTFDSGERRKLDIKLMILGFMQGSGRGELGGVLHHHPCL